jgi:hypothetical protein
VIIRKLGKDIEPALMDDLLQLARNSRSAACTPPRDTPDGGGGSLATADTARPDDACGRRYGRYDAAHRLSG